MAIINHTNCYTVSAITQGKGKDEKMSEAKKKLNLYPIHLVVGFGIIAPFWLMPPIGSITPLRDALRRRLPGHGLSVECL